MYYTKQSQESYKKSREKSLAELEDGKDCNKESEVNKKIYAHKHNSESEKENLSR